MRGEAGTSEAGFSLIEALVALAILAVSAISLLAAAQGHVTRIEGLESRVLEQFVAENRLAELELGIAGDDAPATMLGREFRVTTTRSETEDPDLERIDVAVSDGVRSQSVMGFLAKPPPAVSPEATPQETPVQP